MNFKVIIGIGIVIAVIIIAVFGLVGLSTPEPSTPPTVQNTISLSQGKHLQLNLNESMGILAK
jgi:hypothetical protein